MLEFIIGFIIASIVGLLTTKYYTRKLNELTASYDKEVVRNNEFQVKVLELENNSRTATIEWDDSIKGRETLTFTVPTEVEGNHVYIFGSNVKMQYLHTLPSHSPQTPDQMFEGTIKKFAQERLS